MHEYCQFCFIFLGRAFLLTHLQWVSFQSISLLKWTANICQDLLYLDHISLHAEIINLNDEFRGSTFQTKWAILTVLEQGNETAS